MNRKIERRWIVDRYIDVFSVGLCSYNVPTLVSLR